MVQPLDLPLLISSRLGTQDTIEHVLSVSYAVEKAGRDSFGGGVGTPLREVFDVVQSRLAGVLRITVASDIGEEIRVEISQEFNLVLFLRRLLIVWEGVQGSGDREKLISDERPNDREARRRTVSFSSMYCITGRISSVEKCARRAKRNDEHSSFPCYLHRRVYALGQTHGLHKGLVLIPRFGMNLNTKPFG